MEEKNRVIDVFFRKTKKISAKTLIDLKQYIDHCLCGGFRAAEAADEEAVCAAPLWEGNALSDDRAPSVVRQQHSPRHKATAADAAPRPSTAPRELTNLLEQTDESFSEMLLRKIDEKQMTDAQCYKKAQIDRKLFSKIRSRRDYRPSKATVLSFALALELSLAETGDLLLRAGYALSHSSKADIIVEYFILHQIYDKFLVNEALYEFDQPLL